VRTAVSELRIPGGRAGAEAGEGDGEDTGSERADAAGAGGFAAAAAGEGCLAGAAAADDA
jgi:hypothetical protein